jgi:alkylation response protein AidB-like acyl-CoA dehydrogenase
VPAANLVGEENDGWTVAKYLLEFERGGHNFTIDLKKQLDRLYRQGAGERGRDGRTMLDNEAVRQRLADLEIEALAVEYTELRIKGAQQAGENPGALSSMVKIVGTELSQRMNELSVDLLGPALAPRQYEALQPGFEGGIIGPEYALTAMAEYINNRASTIYGGTAEIQRDIIAKHVLGL